MKKKFPKRDLQDLLWGDSDNLEVVEDNITGTGRWSIHHHLVFVETDSKEYYATSYQEGATEYQEERPFEDDPDEIECTQVKPVEVMRVEYVSV